MIPRMERQQHILYLDKHLTTLFNPRSYDKHRTSHENRPSKHGHRKVSMRNECSTDGVANEIRDSTQTHGDAHSCAEGRRCGENCCTLKLKAQYCLKREISSAIIHSLIDLLQK